MLYRYSSDYSKTTWTVTNEMLLHPDISLSLTDFHQPVHLYMITIGINVYNLSYRLYGISSSDCFYLFDIRAKDRMKKGTFIHITETSL